MNKQVKCPKCSTSFDAEILTTFTPEMPECKELLTGRFPSPRCPKCGTVFTVEQPIVYRDATTDPPYILYCLPPPEDGEISALEQAVDVMATDVFSEQGMARPIVRLVFGMPEFIEKIAIRHLGFDDRLVEYAKLELYRNIQEPKLSRTQHRLLLDYSHCDENNLYFLIFDHDTSKMVNAIQVPMEEFRALMKSARENDQVALELDAAFPGCYVSADRLL